jgi:hypothetical protein
LFYFAGHGIAHDSDAGPAGYLVPAYATRSDERGFLPMQDLHDALEKLPVRHALVVLDCCFAGALRWSSTRDLDPEVSGARIYRERYDLYVDSPAWQVLTSTTDDQLALDVLADRRRGDEELRSPFARALLDGLAGGADLTKDHVMTADELAIFVREQVARTAGDVGRRQVPQMFPLGKHRSGQFVFHVPNQTPALEPAPPLDRAMNPFRSLQGFRAENPTLLHGRHALTQRLVEAVGRQRLTVVVGSGSGKSTLVQAGLLPALEGKGWTMLPMQRPGRAPLQALGALARSLGADGDAVATAPVKAWHDAVTRHAGDPPCLVVIDQLEELVTRHGGSREADAFLEALASALRTAPWLHLVVIMRPDAELQLRHRALGPWWSDGRFVVPPLSRDELRKIIERIATGAVLHFGPPALLERLLDDVALVPAPLPLLSFALCKLYEKCWERWQAGDRRRALLEEDYDEMGGIAGALIRQATTLHDELVAKDPQHAITIRNVFTRMVALAGGELTRRRVYDHELDYGDRDEDQRVEEVLRRFDEARLISRGTELVDGREERRYAEPAHDVLVRGWPLMSGWLDELEATAGPRFLRGALMSAVSLWRTHQEHDSYLWSNLQAELVKRLEHRVLNRHEARFVERSARISRAPARRAFRGELRPPRHRPPHRPTRGPHRAR